MDKIKLAINHKRLSENGFSFDNWGDLYLYVSSLADWLEAHRENYTERQYHNISALKGILDSIDYGV